MVWYGKVRYGTVGGLWCGSTPCSHPVRTQMVLASGVAIAACGSAAVRLRELGVAPTLVPLNPTAVGLAGAIDVMGLTSGEWCS